MTITPIDRGTIRLLAKQAKETVLGDAMVASAAGFLSPAIKATYEEVARYEDPPESAVPPLIAVNPNINDFPNQRVLDRFARVNAALTMMLGDRKCVQALTPGGVEAAQALQDAVIRPTLDVYFRERKEHYEAMRKRLNAKQRAYRARKRKEGIR